MATEAKSLSIIYLGTPDFAVAPLKSIIEAGLKLVAVVSAPDKPAGRGKKMRLSAVKNYVLSLDRHIPILQPSILKDPEFLRTIEGLKPDLQIVVAFRMLPEVVWKIPALGTINLHASLLPQYRGAAPINHVIINGETETGLTTFMIDEKIDTGNILLQQKTKIGENETAGELHDRLMVMGASLVLETIRGLASESLKSQSQKLLEESDKELALAPKLFKEHRRINWAQAGSKVNNHIRGLSPYPAAFSFLEKPETIKILCKIYGSHFERLGHSDPPGTVITDNKRSLKVAVKDGYIHIHSIQQEGKRKMELRDFLAGINLSSARCRFS